MLIQSAEVRGRGLVDVRILGDVITAIGTLTPLPNESRIDARGGCLLPGLHDHHIHLRAAAAALDSLRCGPPEVRSAEALSEQLRAHHKQTKLSWMRGTGYHESVAGDIDREWLDRVVPDLPVRIQHRSGRLWILNSPAYVALIERARAFHPALLPVLERAADGRLLDHDHVMSTLLQPRILPIAAISQQLASFGVTGITDMNPGNDPVAHSQIAAWQAGGDLKQRVHLGGREELVERENTTHLSIGPFKVHLHDHDLPDFDVLTATFRRVHASGRPVAVHCVTELALVFTLAAFEEAGAISGDRIEHASITPDSLLEPIQKLGLTIVTQPHFITERGREYLQDIPAAEHDLLYRCQSFIDAGIPLAGGSDAPFGSHDPWQAMRAAVARQTPEGEVIGARERLTPERALALFTGAAEAPSIPREIAVGARADLCLLDDSWIKIREDLDARHVRMTWIEGVAVIPSRQ